MNKHTPGPWEVIDRKPFGLRIRKKGSGYVASTCQGEIERTCGLANAHLIAAAPEMLDALKRLVKGFNNRDDWKAARAAIDKAKTTL